MTQSRSWLSSMLVMFIVGAAATTDASAAGCTPELARWCLLVESLTNANKFELVEFALFTSGKDVGTKSELEEEGLPSMECETEKAEGTVSSGTRPQVTQMHIDFSGNCKYKEHNEGCTFKEPITTTAVKGELTLVSAKNDLKLTPKSGTFFAFVQVIGASCENAVKIAVTGEQLCEDEHLEKDLLTHLFFCPKSLGSLKTGTKNAALELDFYLALLGHPGDNWLLIWNEI